MRLFWVIMAVLGGGLILLVANHDSGSVLGIENTAFARTLYLGVWASVLVIGLLGSGMHFGQMARSLAFWVLAMLALVAVYQYRYELQDVAARITAGLVPGSPISLADDAGARVFVDRSSGGHFEVLADINGASLRMLIDTGASSVVLSAEDALRSGYDVQALDFRIPVSTANGITMVAAVRAGEIRVGSIIRHNVQVHVAQPGRLAQSLLGMSFINTLSGFDLRGDRIILRD
ncbi:retropepsin-like aspartic protease family protein [Nitratireductor soli]|uniref:retropepsin-like aspartic protease family protein n=1 Tax=Nitratireductor soli TaxID=1670619 RepID=UPI00065DCAA1|nr:TIGR02281 family clan AA aspartic protease [Nitratireductor soli]